jgi:hypothetical protein
LNSEPSPRPRPYWHVDAKWIAGLLLTFVLGPTLLVFGLTQATAEEPAVDTLSMILATSVSRKGLDDETEIAEFRRILAADADGEIQPIPGLAITVREADLADRTPRELRLWLVRQLAEPLYQGGGEGLAELATDPEMRLAVGQGVGALSVFSLETHLLLQRVLNVLAIVTGVLAIPLVYFSYRFGRLASLGWVLLVAALPGAALFGFLGWAFNPPPPAPGPEPGIAAMIGPLVGSVLPPLARVISQTFLAALLAGVILLVLSLIGGLVFRRRRQAIQRADAPAA